MIPGVFPAELEHKSPMFVTIGYDNGRVGEVAFSKKIHALEFLILIPKAQMEGIMLDVAWAKLRPALFGLN